jgi:hypothetical protein
MPFNSDPPGIFFFFLTHLILFSQFFFIFYTTDPSSSQLQSPSSYLQLFKYIFYSFFILSFTSHLRSSFSDPGRITIDNNPTIIDYYYTIYHKSISNAITFTKQQGPQRISQIIQRLNEAEENEEDDSDYDEKEYEPLTTVSDDLIENIKREHNFKLNRCTQCYVVRPFRAHHCSVCQGCILGMHHHCPWINNCVGQFNKKYFILFVVYGFIGNGLSFGICLYYTIYNNISVVVSSKWNIMFVIAQVVMCLVFGVFLGCMIKDQVYFIYNSTLSIDYKNLEVLEKNTFWEEVKEVFGGAFSVGWFFPFTSGGYKYLCKGDVNLIKKRSKNKIQGRMKICSQKKIQ